MTASNEIDPRVIGKILNPFIIGSSMVFSSLFNIDIVRGNLKIVRVLEPSYDIVARVPFRGPVTGIAYYSMGLNVVNRIMERLAPGSNLDEIMADYHDYIGEVAFMITGNALTLLHDEDFKMSLPDVVPRDILENDFDASTYFLKIDINSFFGVIELIMQIDLVSDQIVSDSY